MRALGHWPARAVFVMSVAVDKAPPDFRPDGKKKGRPNGGPLGVSGIRWDPVCQADCRLMAFGPLGSD